MIRLDRKPSARSPDWTSVLSRSLESPEALLPKQQSKKLTGTVLLVSSPSVCLSVRLISLQIPLRLPLLSNSRRTLTLSNPSTPRAHLVEFMASCTKSLTLPTSSSTYWTRGTPWVRCAKAFSSTSVRRSRTNRSSLSSTSAILSRTGSPRDTLNISRHATQRSLSTPHPTTRSAKALSSSFFASSRSCTPTRSKSLLDSSDTLMSARAA